MKRRLHALLCALLLTCSLVLTSVEAAWDDGLIFIAVNINMLPLAQYMPIISGGVYVPVTVFDAATNGGANLGIYGASNKNLNTYTLYSGASKNLIFDLSTGNSYDYLPQDGGTQQTARCIIRNGKIYVTASAVCRYFGIDYTFRASAGYGYPLVRIKTKDAPLTDDEFVNAASSTAMLNVLTEYYKSVEPASPSVTPAPPTPTPAPTSGPGPALKDPGEVDRSGTAFELAFRFESGEAGTAILDALAEEGRCALLFFSPEQLAAQDDLVRRAMGEGHSIGLLIPGDSTAAAAQAVEKGNRLLTHVVRSRTRMVLADGASAEVVEDLSDQGLFCWQGSIDGRPGARSGYAAATDITRQASARHTLARVTMDDTAASAVALPSVLRTLRQEKYAYRLVVETEF